MQANIGENLIIRGINGVELLDAKETYEEKVSQKSTSVGVSVSGGFTPAQLVNTIGDVSNNIKDYGFNNTSQTINTLGNGFQDLRNVTQLSGNLYDGIRAGSQYLNGNINKGVVADAKQNALSNLVSANVSLNYSQSSSESNTSGTTSVAGVINVGGNMIVQSEGDVKFVNQKITVGENLVIDAKNFEALAGENTYKNDTKSSSTGGSVGYDIVNHNMTGGINVSGGNSNTASKTYDNTTINAGGTFQLTTKEDATFKGANVTADKINFDIGKNLNIISLQDEYNSKGKSYGMGVDVSGEIPGTGKETGIPIPSFSGNYSENNENSKWVNNQTSIIAENGGNIKVGETLTNIGAIVGSLSEENKLGIEANKVVIENLKDYNKGENKGAGISGLSPETLIPQTSIQYGSHDKEQNTNATFVNTEVTEKGVKLDLEKLGINTDITKAQVVTKDEVVEQIDTVLHTDMGNKTVRDAFTEDLLKTGALIPEVVQGIKEGINNPGETVLGQIANNMGERSDEIKAFVEGRDKKLDNELDKHRNEKGELVFNDEVAKSISESLQKTLDEYGKGEYPIVYIKGDKDGPSVSINDEDGKMYVNINGNGFGNAEEMRKNTQHDGGHGTYQDRDTDERAADRLGINDRGYTPANTIVDPSMEGILQAGLDAYNKDKADGKIRDKEIISKFKMTENLIKDKGISKSEMEKVINKEFGGNYIIDAKGYGALVNGVDLIAFQAYREKINYYYYQALNNIDSVSELKNGFTKIPDNEAVFHNTSYPRDATNTKDIYINLNPNTINEKYVNYENGKEAVTNKGKTKIIDDPTNRGTFNYYTYKLDEFDVDKYQHSIDIYTWVRYGSGTDDYTSKNQRTHALQLGGDVSKHYNDPKFQEFAKNNNYKITRELMDKYLRQKK